MNKKTGKETWAALEKRIGLKHTVGDARKNFGKVAADILVQRMSTMPSGHMKKYEPMDTREFIPFGNNYDELTIENIKAACESFYNAPVGRCDILASDRGPSCSTMVSDPKSVSAADLLKAGKLVKPPKQERVTLHLEEFDVEQRAWNEAAAVEFMIDGERFAHGGFCYADHAYAQNYQLASTKWVVKMYQDTAIKSITDDLKISIEDHTRKQVQLYAVARSMTKQFSKKAPVEMFNTEKQ
eukprot:gene2723-3148_t